MNKFKNTGAVAHGAVAHGAVRSDAKVLAVSEKLEAVRDFMEGHEDQACSAAFSCTVAETVNTRVIESSFNIGPAHNLAIEEALVDRSGGGKRMRSLEEVGVPVL